MMGCRQEAGLARRATLVATEGPAQPQALRKTPKGYNFWMRS